MPMASLASRVPKKAKVLLLPQEVQFCRTFSKLYNFSSIDSPEKNYFWAYFAENRVLISMRNQSYKIAHLIIKQVI
jgi:hypothetical protein